ncbi:hypothetical protein XENOCAPTIV_019582 [Xenoophorus captivus]|uniref:Uncharacterized protein n=1 Tax=Xenoophorus captivus TaxID=1517983 RepID=A0ABV0SG59_9TELE
MHWSLQMYSRGFNTFARHFRLTVHQDINGKLLHSYCSDNSTHIFLPPAFYSILGVTLLYVSYSPFFSVWVVQPHVVGPPAFFFSPHPLSCFAFSQGEHMGQTGRSFLSPRDFGSHTIGL